MKPYIHEGDVILWNLQGSVGKNGLNRVGSDVAYLQWYYRLAAAHPETPQERRAIYMRIEVNGVCSGRDDDPLVAAIVAHQQRLAHPVVDGRVDPVPGSSGALRVGGGKSYFIIRLGARFATLYPHTWPRIDLIPGCPPSVAVDVRKTIPSLALR